MTTYSWNLTLGETDYMMLEVALSRMIQHCEEEIEKGAGAPFYANKSSAEEVLNRLKNLDMYQISGNNFWSR